MRSVHSFLIYLTATALVVPIAQAEQTQPMLNDTFEQGLVSNQWMFEAEKIVEPLRGMIPPHCPAFVKVLQDESLFRASARWHINWHPGSCILWAFQQLAQPFNHSDFPVDEPMMLVWERLDWRQHPFRLGAHWDRFDKPVYLKDLARGVGLDWVSPWWTVGAWSFSLTIRPKGREKLRRFAFYYGMADWTGDGRADLLVDWTEDSVEGRYGLSRKLLLVRDGPDSDVRVIDHVDWFIENKDRVLSSFEKVKE